jgi:hypothetical protein
MIKPSQPSRPTGRASRDATIRRYDPRDAVRTIYLSPTARSDTPQVKGDRPVGSSLGSSLGPRGTNPKVRADAGPAPRPLHRGTRTDVTIATVLSPPPRRGYRPLGSGSMRLYALRCKGKGLKGLVFEPHKRPTVDTFSSEHRLTTRRHSSSHVDVHRSDARRVTRADPR